MEWISVKDRLPDDDFICFCFLKRNHGPGSYAIMYFQGGEWFNEDDGMPLSNIWTVKAWYMAEKPKE